MELSPKESEDRRIGESKRIKPSLINRLIGSLTLDIPPSDPAYNALGTLEVESDEMDFDSLPIDTSPLPMEERMPVKERLAQMEATRKALIKVVEAKRAKGESLAGEEFEEISYYDVVDSFSEEEGG